MNQIGCDKCWATDAAKAWEAVTTAPIETQLVEEPHYLVSIRKCPGCSQRYLQVTSETIDWTGGEDPIYRSVIPITEEVRERLFGSIAASPYGAEAACVGVPSLHYDWPAGHPPSIYWGIGAAAHIED